MPASNRPPPLAHDSNRMSGNRRVSRSVQLVQAEDVAVAELALAVRRERRAPRLGHPAVHVPLHVGDGRAREDRRPGPARGGRRPPAGRGRGRAAGAPPSAAGRGSPIAQSGWAANSSLRSLTISGSIQIPNRRPSASIRRARPSIPFGSLRRSTNQSPSERVVVVALAEPAVVEHEQLDPEVAGDLGDRDEPVLVEVEVGALPVVHEDRAVAVAPGCRAPAARGTADGTRRSSRRGRRSCGRGPPRGGSAPRRARAPTRTSRGRSRSGAAPSRTARPRPRRGSCPSRRGRPRSPRRGPRSSPRGAGPRTGCGPPTTTPRLLETDWRPMTSGRVRTWRSRAQ